MTSSTRRDAVHQIMLLLEQEISLKKKIYVEVKENMFDMSNMTK